MSLFKRFKKKEKEVETKLFSATIQFKSGITLGAVGRYPTIEDFSRDASNILEYREVFNIAKSNGDRVVIRSEDVKGIIINPKPMEVEKDEA